MQKNEKPMDIAEVLARRRPQRIAKRAMDILLSAAALAALRQLRAHPELVETLQSNALYMRTLLREREIKMRPSNGDRIPIIPIYTYEPIPTLTIAKELYDRGVYVNSSLPPAAAPHECLLRTSLMATHTHALIDEAVGIIADVLRRHDL